MNVNCRCYYQTSIKPFRVYKLKYFIIFIRLTFLTFSYPNIKNLGAVNPNLAIINYIHYMKKLYKTWRISMYGCIQFFVKENIRKNKNYKLHRPASKELSENRVIFPVVFHVLITGRIMKKFCYTQIFQKMSFNCF